MSAFLLEYFSGGRITFVTSVLMSYLVEHSLGTEFKSEFEESFIISGPEITIVCWKLTFTCHVRKLGFEPGRYWFNKLKRVVTVPLPKLR